MNATESPAHAVAASGAASGAASSAIPWTWSPEPVVIVLLLAITLVYGAGMARLFREGRAPAASRKRGIAFAGGIALLVVALLSPLDAWADSIFSAHMAQHLILMMLAPPLLVMSHPIVVGLWALPRGGRRSVAAWWQRSRLVRRPIEFLLSPLPAWIAASAALWFWHLSKPYALAFAHPVAHAAEHLSFFLSAILFWRVVIADPQSRRLSLAATMIFVVTYAMQSGMLSAILIFAPHVLYGVHSTAPSWSALTPLEDQQLAGVLMWSVTGIVDLLALGVLFVAWLASSDRRMPAF